MKAGYCILAAMAALSAPPSARADWVVAAGVADRPGDDLQYPATLGLEVQSAPIWSLWQLEFGLAGALVGTLDDPGDFWVGAGLAATGDLSDRWFAEASLLPGYFKPGADATDLGHHLEFRSLVGLGYKLTPTVWLSMAVDHASNAGLGDRNPGVNSVSLRVRWAM